MHEKVVGKRGSAAMLATKRSAGDAALILKNLSRASNRGGLCQLENPGQTSPEVQNGGISSQTKRTNGLKIFFLKGSQN